MLLSENLDYEYNPIDIIKGNKIKKELKSNPEMDDYKRVKLYKKLIDIHNWLFDEVTGILKNKYLDFYKKNRKKYKLYTWWSNRYWKNYLSKFK